MKIRIDVTNDVIKQAETWRSDPKKCGLDIHNCVISRAVQEHLRDGLRAVSTYRYIRIEEHKIKVNNISDTIFAFDQRMTITPTSFEIDIPEEYLNEYAKEGCDLPQPPATQQMARTEALAHAK